MKKLWLFLVVCIAAASLTLSACGGGGGGGGAPVVDADGDGLNSNIDPNDNDASVFVTATDVLSPLGVAMNADPALKGELFSSPSAVSNAVATETLVVGVRDTASGMLQATAWMADTVNATATRGDLVDLDPAAGFSAAYGVNDNGVIVGESTDTAVTPAFLPVLWTDKDTVAVSLGLGTGTAVGGAAYSINAGGLIVGELTETDGTTTAALWVRDNAGVVTGPTPLTTTDPLVTFVSISSSAYFVDDLGNIVGEATEANGTSHAVMWTAPAGTQASFTDLLETGGELGSVAYGINSLGQIVGEYENLSGVHAAIWTVNQGVVSRIDLDATTSTFSSSAFAISETAAPQIIGQVGSAPVLWDSRTAVPTTFQTLMPSRGATDSQLHDLNDEGVVVGIADNQIFVTLVQ